MKNIKDFRLAVMLLATALIHIHLMAQSTNDWNKSRAEKWFQTKEWLMDQKASEPRIQYDQFGNVLQSAQPDSTANKTAYIDLKKLKPHESINKKEFALQYHAHKLWWDKAFAYLKFTELSQLKPGKYLIDGENVFALVTEGPAKLIDTTKWESHRHYQDIHYVVKGKEKIGVAAISSLVLTDAYNPARDILFYKGEGKYYRADTGNFFIFFPKDGHRPGLKVQGDEVVKKIVVKVKRDNP